MLGEILPTTSLPSRGFTSGMLLLALLSSRHCSQLVFGVSLVCSESLTTSRAAMVFGAMGLPCALQSTTSCDIEQPGERPFAMRRPTLHPRQSRLSEPNQG